MTNEDTLAPITADELKAALVERQFCLYYLPRIDCESLSLKGFEALIRWEHPTRGLVMPDQFIPLAESAGFIGRITEQIVDLALRWYKSTPGVPGLSLSINISSKRLSDGDFADWLFKMCRTFGIRTESIILECSELAVLDERLHAFDMFTRLREKGFKVAIDDFGTGHSSLKTLARLPFTEVKIDKSFAMTAVSLQESRSFLKATIEASHSIKLTVVSEGVEDRETLEYLRQLGCDFVQGFLISPPLPSDQVTDWMIHRRERTKQMLV